jgi:hypothetical protein
VAFNRRLDSIFPGMGQPLRNDSVYLQTGLALTTAASPQTSPIPLTGTLSPTTTAGRMRIKIYNPATSPVLTLLRVLASDGTNSIVIAQSEWSYTGGLALSTTLWFEFEFEYILDVASSGAGGGATGQLSSVVGGANAFSIITTLTGAGGTASMDVEIAPLI